MIALEGQVLVGSRPSGKGKGRTTCEMGRAFNRNNHICRTALDQADRRP
jgi:hypothetical protein